MVDFAFYILSIDKMKFANTFKKNCWLDNEDFSLKILIFCIISSSFFYFLVSSFALSKLHLAYFKSA